MNRSDAISYDELLVNFGKRFLCEHKTSGYKALCPRLYASKQSTLGCIAQQLYAEELGLA